MCTFDAQFSEWLLIITLKGQFVTADAIAFVFILFDFEAFLTLLEFHSIDLTLLFILLLQKHSEIFTPKQQKSSQMLVLKAYTSGE